MIIEEKPEIEWETKVQLLTFKRDILKSKLEKKKEKKVIFSFSFHT